MFAILQPRIVTVSALLTYAFHDMFNVSAPPLVAVGVATTLSPTLAPVTVTVAILIQPVEIVPATKVVVAERCFEIVVPPPMLRLLSAATPLIVVVTPDFPIVSALAFVFPRFKVAAPPVSIVKIFAPFD